MRIVTAAASIALLSVGACGSLPSLGEAPPGYRAQCVVQPSGSALVGPNSLRHSCREIAPVYQPSRPVAITAAG